MDEQIVDQEEAKKLLERVNAIRVGHFVGKSGLHLDRYVDKDNIYPHPTVTERLCREIARRFRSEKIDVVVAPEKGGILLSHEVAKSLFFLAGKEVLSFYAEKTSDDGFIFKRGDAMNLIPRKNVLVAEDILTTGGSVEKVVRLVRQTGGFVVGVGAIWNRNNVPVEAIGGVPKFEVLIDEKLDTWTEEECPRSGPCSRDIPINTEVGHGKEFLARKQKT